LPPAYEDVSGEEAAGLVTELLLAEYRQCARHRDVGFHPDAGVHHQKLRAGDEPHARGYADAADAYAAARFAPPALTR
jgi:hypothetical protein